ncbi:helix-turn-helix domain-containing protein [Enterococcus termitis]
MGTLKRSVKLIEEDFQAFGCEDKIQLTYNEESKAYNLMIAENFSLQFIRLYYLENSIRFKLIEGMFTDTLGDMSEVADQLYLTYSSLRRELHYLKKELQLYDLTIDTKKKIKIKGNELHIRLFYTILYLDSYGGQSYFINTFTNTISIRFVLCFPQKFITLQLLPKESCLVSSLLIHLYVQKMVI